MRHDLRVFLVLCAVLAVSLTSLSASAQEKGTKNRALANGRGGVGVNILNFSDISAGVDTVYVPILINPSFRLEPSLRFLRVSREVSSTTETLLGFGVGLGAFYNWSPVRHTAIYVGPRVEFLYTSSTMDLGNSDTIDSNESRLNLGAALGGEYFFSSAFSLGAEVRVDYPLETDDSDPDASSSEISTGAQVIVRYYFF